MTVKAYIRKLEIGEKIQIGDFWINFLGDSIKRDKIKWRERVTDLHKPHYRVENIYLD